MIPPHGRETLEDKNMLTQRLGSITQKNPDFIDSLINQIVSHPGCCDEVWLATDYGFPSPQTHEESARVLRGVAEKMRRSGIRVSLQLSNSIGHGEYMSSRDCSGLVSENSPVKHMVGADGAVAGYCFCWNGEYLREYTKNELKAYVSAVKPHTVWIDDDLRVSNHHPVDFGCFCDDCVAAFNRKHSSAFSREELVAAINADDAVWRKRWIDFIREGLADFTFDICTAIHEASPETRVGLQGCAHGGYSGLGNGFVTDAIGRATGLDVPYRPGGGAYDDLNPGVFIDKAELMAYDCANLPDSIKEIRPEIESLPDIVYGKSIGGTCFETSYYFSDGCNAMSYAMLMNDYEPMEWHGKMLAAFAAHRAYWSRLSEVNMRSRQTGLKAVFPKTAFLAKTDEPFEWRREYFHFAQPLRYFNIPITYDSGDTSVYLLNLQNARGLSSEELDNLLRLPVVTDGATLEYLHGIGAISACAERIETSRMRECFTEHPVNGKSAGNLWCGRWCTRKDYEIIGGAQPLSLYVASSGTSPKDGSVASAIVTTKYGAQWAVFGFDSWNDGVSAAVRDRYLNACEYIGSARFAAELVTPIRMVVSARVNASGRTVTASFTNVTVGDSGEIEVIIRRPAGNTFTYMGQYIPETVLAAVKTGDDEFHLTLPNVKAWSVASVFID